MLRRHYLLQISGEGRRAAFKGVASQLTANQLGLVEEVIIGRAGVTPVPGIVRREECETNTDMIPVGFSSPFRVNGNRLRIAAFVPSSAVIDVVTPFDVMRGNIVPRTSCLQALAEVYTVAAEMNLELGVWGSAALEVYTGKDYTDEHSDLDLLVGVAEIETVRSFHEQLLKIEKRFACKIDVELDLPSGYGVKLAELFMNTETVLAKGLKEIVLLPKRQILALMGGSH